MKWTVLLKATLLDRSDAQSVSDFNQAIQKLNDMKTGTIKKPRTVQDANKILEDFKINFPKKNKNIKLKNFERAK